MGDIVWGIEVRARALLSAQAIEGVHMLALDRDTPKPVNRWSWPVLGQHIIARMSAKDGNPKNSMNIQKCVITDKKLSVLDVHSWNKV